LRHQAKGVAEGGPAADGVVDRVGARGAPSQQGVLDQFGRVGHAGVTEQALKAAPVIPCGLGVGVAPGELGEDGQQVGDLGPEGYELCLVVGERFRFSLILAAFPRSWRR
jgi:hypothetical protein